MFRAQRAETYVLRLALLRQKSKLRNKSIVKETVSWRSVSSVRANDEKHFFFISLPKTEKFRENFRISERSARSSWESPCDGVNVERKLPIVLPRRNKTQSTSLHDAAPVTVAADRPTAVPHRSALFHYTTLCAFVKPTVNRVLHHLLMCHTFTGAGFCKISLNHRSQDHEFRIINHPDFRTARKRTIFYTQ